MYFYVQQASVYYFPYTEAYYNSKNCRIQLYIRSISVFIYVELYLFYYYFDKYSSALSLSTFS